jgi:diaminohydroxyphosphoribosylaminopyrimidine deaminase/5-amino-6-(5-phosphoribosylamino)uracil reductase
MFQLYIQDIQSVIIEGGAATLKKFIEAKLWDEARIFTGNKILGNGIKSPVIKGFNIEKYIIGADRLEIIYQADIHK